VSVRVLAGNEHLFEPNCPDPAGSRAQALGNKITLPRRRCLRRLHDLRRLRVRSTRKRVILSRGLVKGALGALLCGSLLVPRVAWAEPTEADRATARSLASEGYDALERKDYATAVDRFRHADALVHAPTIGVDLARALIGLGRYVEAYERYELVIREGVPKNSPASWKQAVDDAQKEAADLEPRLGWIVIHVMGPLDPQVTIDGDDVPEGSIGVRRAADPGKRTVRASAPDFEPAAQTVTIKEGQEQVVTLVLKRSPTPHAATPAVNEPSEAPPPPHRTSRVPMWIAFGAGGAGIIVGSVTGVMALNLHSELAPKCPKDVCPPELQSDVKRYHALGITSGIGFGMGVAGAATGLVLLFTGAAVDRAAQRASLWPVIGPREIGMAGRF
jgi:hypothetical protein